MNDSKIQGATGLQGGPNGETGIAEPVKVYTDEWNFRQVGKTMQCTLVTAAQVKTRDSTHAD